MKLEYRGGNLPGEHGNDEEMSTMEPLNRDQGENSAGGEFRG